MSSNEASEDHMDTNHDDLKGRVKQAVADLTDNDGLRREGRADRAGAKVKDATKKIGNKIDDAVDAVKDKLHK